MPKIYRKLFPTPTDYLRRELRNCRSVLDVGCGKNSPVQYCQLAYSVGIDLFKPSLEESKHRVIHSEYILADITKLNFRPKCVDAVVMLDVIEHLAKQDALQLIKRAQNWARKKVVILVPNGFIAQDAYDENPLQVHRSGWSAGEMINLGFKVRGINGLRFLRGPMAELKYRPKYFARVISDCSQKITYFMPHYAYHLLCVKELEMTKILGMR